MNMHEYHIRTTRNARYMVLGDLADPREVWFVIHGYGQLAARFLRRFTSLEGDGRLIVAPEALNRYYFETAPGVHAADAGIGATWMTREDRETDIADYITYLDTLYQFVIGGMQRVPARVVALGFSQGAATTARWAAAGNSQLSDVVLWGNALPPDVPPAADTFHGASLSMVFGAADRHTPRAAVDAESSRLLAAGMDHRVVTFEGGHEITEAGLMDLVRVMA